MPVDRELEKYDDIINLPHHRSTKRPHMSLYDRSAQFAPFAALTGHDAVIKETARLTDSKIELDEETKSRLNEKLNLIEENLNAQPEVIITYFLPDKAKSGGTYVTTSGLVRRIDGYERCIIMKDKTIIPIDDVFAIDGDL